MNKGQHNTFKKLSPDFFSIELAFMEQDKTYSKHYDEVVILLETGLRISEF